MPAKTTSRYYLRSILLSAAILMTLVGCARQPDPEFTGMSQVTVGLGKDAKTTEISKELETRITADVVFLTGRSPASLKMFGAAPLPRDDMLKMTREAASLREGYDEINSLHDLYKALHVPEPDGDDKDLYEDSSDFEAIEDLRVKYDELEKLRQSYLQVIWRGNFDAARMAKGREVYTKRCVQCHGTNGDGNGPQANHMFPRPRDYRKGKFKFRSTKSKVLHSDLVKTVNRGVTGTSMPSFKRLKKAEVEAVVDYVLALTHRGELEEGLSVSIAVAEALEKPEAPASDADEEAIADYKDELAEYELTYLELKQEVIEKILKDWTWDADEEGKPLAAVPPLTQKPRFTKEHVERGKKLFTSIGCIKCHDKDGRGLVYGYNLIDDWNFRTRGADLTSGIFRGGAEPIDIYRKMYVGIDGTVMPSAFSSATMKEKLKEDPDMIWDVVAYVLYLSESRKPDSSRKPANRRSKPIPLAGDLVIPHTNEVMQQGDSSALKQKTKPEQKDN